MKRLAVWALVVASLVGVSHEAPAVRLRPAQRDVQALLPLVEIAAARIRARQREQMRIAAEIAEERGQSATILPFRGAGREIQTATYHEWLLSGPADTAKTYAGLARLDRDMRIYPRARGAIVRKVRADMDGTVLETWDRVTAVHGAPRAIGGSRVVLYQYPNGSRVYVGGMDRPGKVLSGERDAIYVNQAEELEEGDWQTLTTRCTGRGAVSPHPWLGGDCNPGPPDHWILQREPLKLLRSYHRDNPTIYDDGGNLIPGAAPRIKVLQDLTGILRARLYEGLWAGAEGAVYADFDRDLHIIDPFEIPPSWPRIASIDFGFTAPFVWQLWALDSDRRMYLEREIYMTQRLVSEHAATIKRWTKGLHVPPAEADHADAEGRATLKAAGIETRPAEKSRALGRQAIMRKLKKQADGRPRIFLLRNALVERDEARFRAKLPWSTAQEFPLYVFRKATDGRSLTDEDPVGEDHGLDAGRYAAVRVPDAPSVSRLRVIAGTGRSTRGIVG